MLRSLLFAQSTELPVTPVEASREEIRRQLVFAFATGDIGEYFDELVDLRSLPKSSWNPAEFEEDLFLETFLDRCFTPRVRLAREGNTAKPNRDDGRYVSVTSRAFVRRVVASPPRDPRDVAHRQQILQELSSNPELRQKVERFYAAIIHLRTLLSKTGFAKQDPFERRLGVLAASRDAILCATEVAGESGLSTIGEWGGQIAESKGFSRVQELLAYEREVAEIDVRLRIGFDGSVREFAILDERVSQENPFVRSVIGKWAEKASLLIRGYKVGDHELFARLMDTVFDGIVDALIPVFLFLGDVQVILGALAFRDRALAAGLETSLATMVDEGGPTRLAKLFNPLLLAAKSGIAPVPCDLTIEAPKSLVVVTGPNSGGKTRMLQALAYAQLLGQGGFFAPAALLELPVAGGLFVSLIDRADADQSEGRLGTELLRIRRLFESLAAVRQERARVSGSAEPLVILDELCSGTNPDEGETIFRLVVKLLGTAVRPSTFVTTHFLAFAARLEQEAERQEAAHPALEFLSVELDAEERPTYGFRRGVAKTSLAHRTAERLGVTEDALRRLLEGAASALDS